MTLGMDPKLEKAPPAGDLSAPVEAAQAGADSNASKEAAINSLEKAAQAGKINALYALIKQHPHILEDIEKIPFVNTPLHTAAAAGKTHFAIEIMSLMPSFGKKLNSDGDSPLHLALQNRQFDTVKLLIKIDSGLIRVKGKNRFTLLHCAAKINEPNLLAEFLIACPASIEDLTFRHQTAVHVAIESLTVRGRTSTSIPDKNMAIPDQSVVEVGTDLDSVKVLLGWLHRSNKSRLLKWRDEKGNTVLHVAASTNQREVVDLLKLQVNIINCKNSAGLTALDLAYQAGNKDVAMTLKNAGALKGEKLPNSEDLTKFLISREGAIQGLIRFAAYLQKDLSLDMRNVLLVVAVLVATATYQAVISPPGGLWQGKGVWEGSGDDKTIIKATTSTNSSTTNNTLENPVGKVVMEGESFQDFMPANTIAFTASIAMILCTLQFRPYSLLLHLSLLFLMHGYLVAADVISKHKILWVGILMYCLWAAVVVVFGARCFSLARSIQVFRQWWLRTYSFNDHGIAYRLMLRCFPWAIPFVQRLKMQRKAVRQ